MTQEIHAQSKVLQREKEENAQPWGGGIAADPGENQSGQQKVEHE